jgi:hypothetical protein
MGLRGPRSMSQDERAARGGRDRSKDNVPDAARLAWAQRAEKLEHLGLKIVEAATAPVNLKRKRRKVIARLTDGLKLLDAADKLWLRIARVGPPAPAGKSSRPSDLADSLDAYSKRRHRD